MAGEMEIRGMRRVGRVMRKDRGVVEGGIERVVEGGVEGGWTGDEKGWKGD